MIRFFNHYLSVRLLVLTAFEALLLLEAMRIGFRLHGVDADTAGPLLQASLFTVVMLTAMSALGLFRPRGEAFSTTVHRVLIAYGLTVITMGALLPLASGDTLRPGVLASSSLIALVGLLLARLAFFRLSAVGLPRRRVLVLGNGGEAEQVIRDLHRSLVRESVSYAGLYPVMAERDETGRERILNHDALMRTIRELRVSEIVVAVRERRGGVLPLRQLLDAKLRGIRVMDLQSFYEREMGVLRIDTMRASWMIFGDGFDQGMARDVVKRIFDLVASLALLVVTLPVLLVAMLAIVIESGGPVFYRQERVGAAGRTFRIVKLRTMRTDAEADGKPRWAGVGDPRVTRVGALLRSTRIDELPQLWNVLTGTMSFVGPRPERPYFVEQLTQRIPFYQVRHSIKPGITGWSQVRYPYGASVEDGLEKLQYDLYYVKNHSLFLDLLILLETVQVVVLAKGAR
jgi:sugar transferase (PEP-CTERM system associated)